MDHDYAYPMAAGIITQTEESKLREFRDRLALDSASTKKNPSQQLEKASKDQPMLDACLDAPVIASSSN